MVGVVKTPQQGFKAAATALVWIDCAIPRFDHDLVRRKAARAAAWGVHSAWMRLADVRHVGVDHGALVFVC
jgi:hypothetical protein